ncbi:ATP-binding protein [Umezawaea sp. NPDC059074]|uniref:ATP-binding protein n=1 Tax=Umezawaea sp. NPDC059074 TaxID=3346716 RepID=UPI0036A29ECD
MTLNEFSGTSYGTVVQAEDVTLLTAAAPPVAMAGLPAQPVFVGREKELGLLVDALGGSDEQAVVVWSLGGLAGVGKTALAVRAAHQALGADWFPGGVVMVNLRGYDPPAARVTAHAALASLLGALGVESTHIPAGVDDRARLWRSVLARRERTLVLADNVSTADQVLPLLPGTEDHRVVITSRHRLADLEGARLVDLDVMSPAEAVRMLSDVLAAADPGDRRVLDDPASIDTIVRLCGHLPLAIRVAAALLASEPDCSPAELAVELADERRRLEALRYSEGLEVRAAFDLSYAHLEETDARLFRLIALNPGPEIGIDAVAALVGVETIEARRVVRLLVRAHLLQPGSTRGRWRMHDLLHLYAAEKASEDPQRLEVTTRLLAHYASGISDVDAVLRRLVPEEGGRLQALEWADTERTNLLAAVSLAFASGHDENVVLISLKLNEYLDLRHLRHEVVAIGVVALACSRRLGDRKAESQILIDLGVAYRRTGQLEEALDSCRQAIDVCRRSGDRLSEGKALNCAGDVHRLMGDLPKAIETVGQGLALLREHGSPTQMGGSLFSLAVAHRLLGQFDRAIEYHQQDLLICRDANARVAEGRALNHLGVAYRELGRFAEAVEHHRQNLVICAEMGDRSGEAATHAFLGVTYGEWGRWSAAIASHLRALDLFRASGDRLGEGGVLIALGGILRRTGRLDEARVRWAAAVEIFDSLPGTGPAASADEARALLATPWPPPVE